MATKDPMQKNNKNNKISKNKRINYDKRNKEIEKHNTNSKNKKKKVFVKKYKIDILDVLLIIVFTTIISSLITGFLFNYQYKKRRSVNEALFRFSRVR